MNMMGNDRSLKDEHGLVFNIVVGTESEDYHLYSNCNTSKVSIGASDS